MLWLVACTMEQPEPASEQNQMLTSVSGHVVDLFGGSGVEDVEVCLQHSKDLCVLTNAEGRYELEGIETDTEHVVFLQHSELVLGAISFTAYEEPVELNNVSLLSEELINGQLAALDQEWLEGTGIVAFSISNGVNGDGINIEGIGVSSDDGLVYFSNDLGLPVDGFDVTSLNGGGVIIQLEHGEHQISYSGLPQNCDVILGWGSTDEHRVSVFAQRISFARLECISQ